MFTKRLGLPALAFTALFLSACGGGGGDGPTTRGAIAISDTTGMAAMIWNAADQNVANDQARSKCGGGDCKVILQFSECGALSVAANKFIYGVAEGQSAAAAQQAADSSCTAKGGTACAAVAGLPAQCN
ncbi:DUF4189 domain-containing protein [Hydrogenophaga pseudoflava]|uniref:DUF4189 domain-containing protein n=1 Tax=Hydrogenophaga pseudoflava TaxID=47421 RepID=UPI0027E57520|nr:DUF4189 domain-containing protein [Hydrogenophaga pseudoflava]MDQ7747115.1 DUF4189 domain-containing protein [Hydrogenophaga pseudoflava]